MNGPFRRILSFLIIFALMSAGISPACKFISGKTNFIEICSGNGLKTIAVPTAQDKTQKNHDHKQTSQQCEFCVAYAKVKILKPETAVWYVLQERIAYEAPLEEYAVLSGKTYTNFSARGPPVNFVL